MAAAIRDMPQPPGLRRTHVPEKWGNRSALFDTGVRYEQDCANPDPQKQRWFCMASAACRRESMKAKPGGGISCTASATGNATRHLSVSHGIGSGKTRASKAMKDGNKGTAMSKAKRTVISSTDPARIMTLLYVKTFVVAHLLPFSLSDSKDVRAFFDVCCETVFPQGKLYPRMIRHHVVELYRGTMSLFVQSLRQAVAGAGAGGAALHANFDLWTSKTSNEKYIGLRLFWCTPKFVLCSALLAVKRFQPAAELSDGTQLSDALLLWTEEVLEEIGLETRDLFSTVTDAGSDVKRLCLKVCGSAWEWSLPHMLNCALVEAFGANASIAACKNPDARAVIDAVREVAEHFSSSVLSKVKDEDLDHLRFDMATNLLNAAPHRWSSVCNVLEEVLRNWAPLEQHYESSELTAFPLAPHQTAIEELFSLMKPVADLMRESQQTGVPTGLNMFLALVVLRCTVLDVSKTLTVTVTVPPAPRKTATPTGQEAAVGDATTATTTASAASIERSPASLEAVTAATRQLLACAVDKRFFDARYDEDAPPLLPPPDYLFEMSACMSPFFVKLQWLTVLCSSVAEAQRVGELIKGKVVDLMVTMAEEADGGELREEPKEEPRGGKKPQEQADKVKPTVPQKRKLSWSFVGNPISTKKSNEQTQRLLASGIFGESSAAPKVSEPVMLTVREVCQREFDRFQARFGTSTLGEYPVAYLLSFWDNERVHYPNMARVARVLLSLPASSTVVERDFSTAGRLLPGSGSGSGSGGGRPDAAYYAEMVLFLNGNQDSIPAEVPALSIDQARDAIPVRLTNPSKRVADLSAGEEDGWDQHAVDEYAAESREADLGE